MRVALYARVSSEEQAERGSIQSQLDFLTQYVTLHNLTVYDVYADDGVSGTLFLTDRPAGSRLLRAAAEGAFGAVIVYRLDRLGRTLAALVDAQTRLEKLGVAVKSATEPFDTSSPVGRFVFQLLASLAELEREVIRERSRLGLDRRIRSGRPYGRLPYGYMPDPAGRPTPSTFPAAPDGRTEADIVREIFRQAAAGVPYRQIARSLNAQGIPKVIRYTNGRELRGRWHFISVYHIVHNPAYLGRGEFGRAEIEYPALVSPALFDLAHHPAKPYRGDETYLLRGLVRCGFCGEKYKSMVRQNRRSQTKVYAHRDRPCARGQGQLNAEILESFVWGRCREFLLNPGEYLAKAQAALAAEYGDLSKLNAELEYLTRRAGEKYREKDRVIRLFRAGFITEDDVARHFAEIDGELAELERQRTECKLKIEALTGGLERFQDAEAFLAGVRAGLLQAEADPVLRGQVVRMLVKEIIARGKQVEVVFRFPAGERTEVSNFSVFETFGAFSPVPSPA